MGIWIYLPKAFDKTSVAAVDIQPGFISCNNLYVRVFVMQSGYFLFHIYISIYVCFPNEWDTTPFYLSFSKTPDNFFLGHKTSFKGKNPSVIVGNRLICLKYISSYLNEIFLLEMNNLFLVFLSLLCPNYN